jgi:hypothetical protein
MFLGTSDIFGTDPHLWLTDPALDLEPVPDLDIFVSNLQDANNFFFFRVLILFEGTLRQ